MTTTALPPEACRSGFEHRAEMAGNLSPDLERFWPSRRGHAYDEFCR